LVLAPLASTHDERIASLFSSSPLRTQKWLSKRNVHRFLPLFFPSPFLCIHRLGEGELPLMVGSLWKKDMWMKLTSSSFSLLFFLPSWWWLFLWGWRSGRMLPPPFPPSPLRPTVERCFLPAWVGTGFRSFLFSPFPPTESAVDTVVGDESITLPPSPPFFFLLQPRQVALLLESRSYRGDSV